MIFTRNKPSPFSEWALNKVLPDYMSSTAPGDFEEVYSALSAEKGGFHAWLWYWKQIAHSFPGFLKGSMYSTSAMLKVHAKTGLRNIYRRKIRSLISLSGLSLGLTSIIMIFLYVQNELRYDTFHANADRLFRLVSWSDVKGREINYARTPYPWAPALQREFPEIERIVRIKPPSSKWLIAHKDKRFLEHEFYFADKDVFNVFSFKLVEGDPETVLSKPNSVVLTEEYAKKYFGNSNPVGEKIIGNKEIIFTVTGVVADPPHYSHIQFDFLVSFSTLEHITEPGGRTTYAIYLGSWMNHQMYTYILFKESVDPVRFEKKLHHFFDENARYLTQKLEPYLINIEDIHLKSRAGGELEGAGNIKNVFLLITVGLFILFIIFANFFNSLITDFALRKKETKMRKVVGAKRHQIRYPFIVESTILWSCAFIISMITVAVLVEPFASVADRTLHFSDALTGVNILLVVLFSLCIAGILGGFAGMFSKSTMFRSQNTGKLSKLPKILFSRKTLVIAQYSVLVALLIGSSIVRSQINYLKNEDTEFNKNFLVAVQLTNIETRKSFPDFRRILLENPSIIGVTASSNIVGARFEGGFFREIDESNDALRHTRFLRIDKDFANVLEIEMVSGGNPDQMEQRYNEINVWVNEAFTRRSGMENPLGKKLDIGLGSRSAVVTGVIKDFHYESLHWNIYPLVLILVDEKEYNWVIVRAAGQDLGEAVRFVRSKWETTYPQFPFEYKPLTNVYNEQYDADTRFSTIITYFTIVALIIGCLGLFELSTDTVMKKLKEVGIKKILGASVSRLTLSFAKEFGAWIFIANLFAWPLAYYFTGKWLNTFAHRIEIGIDTFLWAAVASFFIAAATLSFRMIKAALVNPVMILHKQ